jgi:hypothetical protein
VIVGPIGWSWYSSEVATPKGATPAANGPEEIGVFIRTCPEYLAVGGDEFDRLKIVEGKPILAHQPAQSASEGEAGDTRRRHHPAGYRQAVPLRLTV